MTVTEARNRLVSAIVSLPDDIGEYGVLMLIGYDIANYAAAVRQETITSLSSSVVDATTTTADNSTTS